MDYQRIYNQIIYRAKNRSFSLPDEYLEEHHIIPDSFFINNRSKGKKPGWLTGDSNHSDNLVLLTPEEHYVAHQLLVKIYPGNANCINAATAMTMNSNGNRPKNKLYGWIKRKSANLKSSLRKNKTYEELYGIEKAKETKEKISIGNKNKNKSDEHKSNISRYSSNRTEKHKKNLTQSRKSNGKPWHTEETRMKMRIAKKNNPPIGNKKQRTPEILQLLTEIGKNSRWYTDGKTTKFIHINDPVPANFVPGRKLKKNK